MMAIYVCCGLIVQILNVNMMYLSFFVLYFGRDSSRGSSDTYRVTNY